jgi:hypothetical protein
MLQNLIDRTRSLEGLIVGFNRESDCVTLRIQLLDPESTAPLDRWQVQCAGFEEFTIRHESGYIAAFNATHAAVRQYVDPHAQVFFAGAAANPQLLAERLRAAHNRIAGDWIPFERFTNSIPAADLLGRSGGKIFSGPLFLAREIERVLREAGVTTTVLPDGIAAPPAF